MFKTKPYRSFQDLQAVFTPLFLFMVLAIGACKKSGQDNSQVAPTPPVAGFSYQVSNDGFLPANVNFTSSSKNASAYHWDFGDGNSSSEQNPSNAYSKAGSYRVKLVVKNDAGVDSLTQTLAVVLNKPKANFTFAVQNDGTVPCIVNFTSTSTNATTYHWDFGDGGTSASGNAQHTFNQSVTYNVRLVATNASGSDTLQKGVTISHIQYSVRVVLITPTDRKFNQKYYDALKDCAVKLQAWYKQQMGGKTFKLNNPIVDTVSGKHAYGWYNQYNDTYSGTDPRYYGYYNTLYEVNQVLGNLDTKNYMTAVYVAAPGGGAGSTGFCALGDQDLDGLLGLNTENLNKNRWVGGSGHEWGHGFGLPHPDNQNGLALMWTGYLIWPDCILQQGDKDILNSNPLFK